MNSTSKSTDGLIPSLLRDKKMMKTLAKIEPKRDNTNLSQNAKAVTPNGLNWLFLRLSTAHNGISAGVNPPSINLATGGKCIPFMVWLILQNKPIGEYVERLLLRPRVRPHRPLLGKLLKTAKGVFPMNTKHTPPPATGTSTTTTHLQSLAKNCVLVDNTTTTLKAVMPSRHTLAIFTFTCQVKQALSVTIISLLDTCKSKLSSVYGGLIGANTRPKGNSPSRLLAVVETRHPMHGVVSLTKLKGNPTMSEIRYITPPPATGTSTTTTHLQSLAKNCVLVDNTATTLKAVMPSRHTLAIFTPIMGVIRHLKSYGLSVYGGLIGANTRPKGNSPSRLLAVVETRHPMHGVVSLTKLKGNPTMSEIRYITLNALLDEYHHLTATGEHDRANALYNAYTLLKQVDNSFYTNSTQSIPPSPLVGVLACLCSYLASKGV